MKKNLFTAAFTLALSLNVIGAQADNRTDGSDAPAATTTYYINAPRFVRPLVEKWISEYKKTDPSSDFAIAKSASTKKLSSINIQLQERKDTAASAKVVYFAQYAILPVTSKDSEADKALAKRSLNTKALKKLFFVGDDIEEAENKDKLNNQVVVYAGSGSSSIATPFAAYYGEPAANFRGKRVAGDDAYLNTAIAQDPKGVTFNALPNVYNLQNRQLRSEIAVLPLDLSKEQQASLSSLDQLISTLESGEIKGIPVEKVAFAYTGSTALDRFVSWVLTNGTAYNHAYGLLQLNSKDATRQLQQVNSLTAQQ
ncbi:MAG: hypothetical protein KA067_02120 [Prevotella sp.]|nr:hypothetical protein [Prevotella sp.]